MAYFFLGPPEDLDEPEEEERDAEEDGPEEVRPEEPDLTDEDGGEDERPEEPDLRDEAGGEDERPADDGAATRLELALSGIRRRVADPELCEDAGERGDDDGRGMMRR